MSAEEIEVLKSEVGKLIKRVDYLELREARREGRLKELEGLAQVLERR